MNAPPFSPLPLFKGPHRQTFAGWLSFPEIPLPGTRIVPIPLEENDSTTLHFSGSEDPDSETPTLILLHGLEGDAGRPYVLRTARKAAQAGFRTARLNMRCCGDAEGLSTRFYHGAQSEVVAAACDWIQAAYPKSPICLLGFSLGGNLALRAAALERIPNLLATVAICPPVDAHLSAQALCNWENRHYHYRFVRSMVARVHRLQQRTGISNHYPLSKRMTLMEFDTVFTVPHGGFRDLNHYYDICSTRGLLEQITTPWLIIAAQDDPMVPFVSFHGLEDHPNLLAPAHGGHLGFVGQSSPGDPDWRWSENRAIDFLAGMVNGDGVGDGTRTHDTQDHNLVL